MILLEFYLQDSIYILQCSCFCLSIYFENHADLRIFKIFILFYFIFLCSTLDCSKVCGLFVVCAKNRFQYLSCIFSMEVMPAWSNVPVYISFLSSSLFLKIVRFLQHLCAYWSLIAQGPKQLSFLRWAPYIRMQKG